MRVVPARLHECADDCIYERARPPRFRDSYLRQRAMGKELPVSPTSVAPEVVVGAAKSAVGIAEASGLSSLGIVGLLGFIGKRLLGNMDEKMSNNTKRIESLEQAHIAVLNNCAIVHREDRNRSDKQIAELSNCMNEGLREIRKSIQENTNHMMEVLDLAERRKTPRGGDNNG